MRPLDELRNAGLSPADIQNLLHNRNYWDINKTAAYFGSDLQSIRTFIAEGWFTGCLLDGVSIPLFKERQTIAACQVMLRHPEFISISEAAKRLQSRPVDLLHRLDHISHDNQFLVWTGGRYVEVEKASRVNEELRGRRYSQEDAMLYAPQGYMPRGDALKFLGLTRAQLDGRYRQGHFRGVKIGRFAFYNIADLMRLKTLLELIPPPQPGKQRRTFGIPTPRYDEAAR